MTAANGLNRGDPNAAASALRRCAANVVAALGVLARPARMPARNPWPLTPQQLVIAAGIVVLVFLLVQFVADGAAIRAIARLPRWLVWFFDQITDFGKSGWFLWPLGILFLVLAALPGLFTTIVKHIFGRARPLVGGSLNPYLFSPFTWPAAYASLPSGHATTVFSVLVAFGTLWPRARTILWIYALLIAVSRVVVTAHYPSDVLAGAVVGVVGVLLVRRYFALRRLGFSVGPDAVLHQKPGPSLRRIKSVARALLSQ
jgi:membrane-associated phospholipid phosphatase